VPISLSQPELHPRSKQSESVSAQPDALGVPLSSSATGQPTSGASVTSAVAAALNEQGAARAGWDVGGEALGSLVTAAWGVNPGDERCRGAIQSPRT
jgi:hypothetical protein